MTNAELKPVIKGPRGTRNQHLKDNSWLTILSIADGSVFGSHAILVVVAATVVAAPCWCSCVTTLV